MARASRRSATVDLTEEDETEGQQSHRTRLQSRNADHFRTRPVLWYPPDELDNVTLTVGDMDRLNHGEFLNDSLIDFHCRWTSKQMQPHVAKRFHIFSSFLYAKLAQDLPRADTEADAVKWSKGVDVFAKDYLLIPICQRLHWSLAVVCFPRLEGECLETPMRNNAGGDLHQDYQVPCILHFNSIRKNVPIVFQRIRGYLQRCWDVHHAAAYGPRQFTSQALRGYNPNCPQQTNEWDCGIYVLEFIKRLCLDSPEPTIEELRNRADKSSFFNRRAWFKPIDLERSRDKFRELVETMQLNMVQQDQDPPPAAASAAHRCSEVAAKRARDDDECVEVEVIEPHGSRQPPLPDPPMPSHTPKKPRAHSPDGASSSDVMRLLPQDEAEDEDEDGEGRGARATAMQGVTEEEDAEMVEEMVAARGAGEDEEGQHRQAAARQLAQVPPPGPTPISQCRDPGCADRGRPKAGMMGQTTGYKLAVLHEELTAWRAWEVGGRPAAGGGDGRAVAAGGRAGAAGGGAGGAGGGAGAVCAGAGGRAATAPPRRRAGRQPDG